MPDKTSFGRISPTLVEFAVVRTGSAEMLGRYCSERDEEERDDAVKALQDFEPQSSAGLPFGGIPIH